MFTSSFLMTSLAGASTMLGSLLIFSKKERGEGILISSLAFAAGVMICVSLTDLVPESFHALGKYLNWFPLLCIVLIGINLGILLSRKIEKKVAKHENSSSLYKIGIISMLAIILHNIPEGVATYISCENNFHLGLQLTLAIALHNIPEGISISIPIYYATKSKRKAFLYTMVSGLSEVVVAIIAFLFLKNMMNDFFMGFLYSMIAGIMLSISIRELLPTSLSYAKYKNTILSFLFGICFMLASHFLLYV